MSGRDILKSLAVVRYMRGRSVQGLLGVALVATTVALIDWHLSFGAAGLLLYLEAAWGRP